jgi:hypothetical protein
VLRQYLRDRRRQRRFSMVDVTNRSYIDVRLTAFKLFLRHRLLAPQLSVKSKAFRKIKL